MKVSIGGKEFNVADQPADFWGWVQKGNYDLEWKFLRDNLRPEHTFLDLGAWVGSHSLYASTIAKRVVAVEPDPVAYNILTENIQGTGIKAYPVAVGKDGTLELGSAVLGASTTRANRNEGNGIGAWAPDQTFLVPSYTLRDFVQHRRLDGPLFIKIDVEGSEEEILKDLAFFKEHRPTVYIEVHPFWWTKPDETYDNLQKLGRLYGAAIHGNALLIP